MTVLEVALGVSLVICVSWWLVDHLLAMCRIEELEAKISGCEKDLLHRRGPSGNLRFPKEVKNAKKNR